MDQHDLSRVVYLVLLGSFVASYFFVSGRQNWSKTAQQAAIWGLIFLGAIAGYGLWEDIKGDHSPRQAVLGNGDSIELPMYRDGHYYLEMMVNGEPVEFVVDTGATNIVMSQRDAKRIGLDISEISYSFTATTANGIVRTGRIPDNTLEVGRIRDIGMDIWVNDGEMDENLLGMDYLSLFDKIEISNGTLILTR